MTIQSQYTVEAGTEFAWSSVTGTLDPERVQTLARHLAGPRVLDAGCGGGAYVHHLSRQGFDVTGIDAHEALLRHARDRGLAGTFVQTDMNEPLPFPDKSFDSTYCFDVLEHIDDEFAVSELVRVTRSRVIVTVPAKDLRTNKYGVTYCAYLDPTHLRYYTYESFAELLATTNPTGFEIYPESRIPLETLVKYEFTVRSRWPLLGLLYRRAFSFLAARGVGPDWHINWLGIIKV